MTFMDSNKNPLLSPSRSYLVLLIDYILSINQIYSQESFKMLSQSLKAMTTHCLLATQTSK
jgi:hypothetical protein